MNLTKVPSTAVLASALLLTTSLTAMAADVTSQRLMNPDKEPQNWLMVNRDYSSHRYSELDQINKDNVKNLHVAYTVALGGVNGIGFMALGGHESTPLVNDGFMYVVDGFGAVYRIDVRDPMNARVTWVMDPGVNKADMFTAANRGVALYKNFVVSVTNDCKVNWTKADTGELVKSVQFDDMKESHCALTSAPLVIGDKLVVGGSGGDRGARTHIDAFNADTGEHLWRTYSVPAPDEPGGDTWKGHRGLEARRRCVLADRILRPGNEFDDLGHRPTRADVRSGIPPGRQPVHQLQPWA
jgi:alcohol dehydrogenase (cytochrome c)